MTSDKKRDEKNQQKKYLRKKKKRKKKLVLCLFISGILIAGILCKKLITYVSTSGNDRIDMNKPIPDNYKINVPVIMQNPDLPTGCEVTSLTMVLQYLGYSIDKCKLSDSYLPKGAIGETDFNEAFVGNPRDKYSYGCYAPVIVKTANNYLKDTDNKKQNINVMNLTRTKLEDLFVYLVNDIPVIVGGTINNTEPYYTTSWDIEGKNIQWLSGEHCLVLCGYDKEKGVVIVNDPLHGVCEYKLDLFERNYIQMGAQAVILTERKLDED